MNKPLKQTLFLFMLYCACAEAVFAQTATSSSAFDRLDVLLKNIETLSADVVQLILESDGGVLEESEIKMLLKKPPTAKAPMWFTNALVATHSTLVAAVWRGKGDCL